MPVTRIISVSKSARYELIGTPGPHIKRIWIALHGYGMLSTYFARHFEPLAREHTLIVLPEGLSRFYLSGTQGRVGASWMTREERLQDIADNHAYLDALIAAIKAECAPAQAELHLFGFSQGGATAARYAATHMGEIQSLTLWGSALPPDLELSKDTIPKDFHVNLVGGEEDAFFSQDMMNEAESSLKSLGIRVRALRFAGGHTLHAGSLDKILNAV